MKGTVLVKLAPASNIVRPTARNAWSADASLNAVLSAQGVVSLQAIFPTAQTPEVGKSVVAPDGSVVPEPDLTRWYRATLTSTESDVAAAVQALAVNPAIVVAEPDYVRKPVGDFSYSQSYAVQKSAANIPGLGSDPLYSQQWHLGAAHVPEAWAYLESQGLPPGGNRDIVVAVIDTGVDYTHPDLAANIWTNSREIAGNNKDDDADGYVDDVHGANMISNSGDPQDDHGHGTHVAGIIAAQADNGIGGVGVAYNVQIMPIKAAQYSGVLAVSDIAEGIQYAVAHGADVINMSFGGYARSQVEEDALTVAFGTSVLVAAAGNDGYPNEGPCVPAHPMYPAAYNWVLGVMASASGGGRATFSNYDCVSHTTAEYELLAPGVDVWSTLPNNQYAAWDGTSMAAPIVAGIAALARTKWSDKDLYSSRFIMGQIASNAASGANALAALTVAPKPELSYLQHWLFDTTAQASNDDGDGIVDAGETVDLAIVIRNHWGKADSVTVTLEPWAQGAFQPDPYVTMITSTVDYGAIGSFNWDDNGLIYDAQGAITGVRTPFRFTTFITTPNDHVIPFKLTMVTRNGLDLADSTVYTFVSRFNLLVQRGRELPRIISQDMTLTKDDYWLVPDQTLIPAGVSVTVTEGTQIQFWSTDPNDPYSTAARPLLQIEGNLNVQGTVTEPVEMFSGELYPGFVVELTRQNNGYARLIYTRIQNPFLEVSDIDHSYFGMDLVSYVYRKQSGSPDASSNFPSVRATNISNSIYHKLSQLVVLNRSTGNLYDSSIVTIGDVIYIGYNTFLRNHKDALYNSDSGTAVSSAIYLPTFLRTIFPVTYGAKTYVTLSGQRGNDSTRPLSIDDAQWFAKRFGGDVVTINDAAENTFLGNYRSQYLNRTAFQAKYPNMNCGILNCWDTFGGGAGSSLIGLTDKDVEGTFVWMSGEPVTYTSWALGNPEASDLKDYVTVNDWGDWRTTYLLFDWYSYILELPGIWTQAQIDAVRDSVINQGDYNKFSDNAILNEWWDPNTNHWLRFITQSVNDGRNWRYYLGHNFWGTTSTTLIDAAITDYNDDFNRGTYVYQPILTTPPTMTYPFVADVALSTSALTQTTIVGAEPVTFTVTFNRDMEPSVQPQVSFGPDVPNTDYTVHPIDGGWQDARTWVGRFNITPITGDGYQLIRVASAVAADDPWLVTGDDAGRFRFEVITSGSEAMNLQATGGEGYVDLSWTQTDFDLLSGFNIYRSTSITGTYTRVNASIIPPDVRIYRDSNVTPGKPYFYKFTVVKSDMTESDYSNVAQGTPIDTILPVITHTPLTEATSGLPLSLYADVTDNVGVQGVTLFYRAIGASTYISRTMVRSTGNRFNVTIEGSTIASPGVQYYIEATDGVGISRIGRADYPYQITVADKPVVTAVSPNHGPSTGGTVVTIAGTNFKPGASVTFGGAAASEVTVLSSNQITCITPLQFPSAVDVTVINADTQRGVLLRGFTYESDQAALSLPILSAEQHALIDVPINASNLQGFAAAVISITFDSNVVLARSARTGTLTPDWSMAVNTNTPGQVVLAIASSGSMVSGAGVVAYVQFEVVGSPSTTSTLHIGDAALNDGAISALLSDGTLSVNRMYSVAGTARFWKNSTPISGVLAMLEGDRLFTATSSVSGTFNVIGVPADDYTLVPGKLDDAAGISSYDASLVLQHSVGLITLSGYPAVAANVDKNDRIGAMDAFYILQYVAGLTNLPFQGAGVVWQFDPPSRAYSGLSSDRTGQDFTAILLGDVSGNWSSGGQGMLLASIQPAAVQDVTATLSLGQGYVAPSQRVTVPLSITLTQGQLYAADINLTYDPAVVTAVTVLKGSLVTNWSVVSNPQTPGVIRIAMAGATPVVSSGELLQVVFQAVGASGTGTDLTLTRSDLNEGAIPSAQQPGHIAVVVPAHAAFTVAPLSGVGPLTVVFNNTSSGDYTNNLWSFGDGFTSTQTNPSHTYTMGGIFTVTLTVDGHGGVDTLTRPSYVTVQLLSITGTVHYWSGATGVPGVALTLTGSNAYNAQSTTSGAYQLAGLLSGNYTLVPTKTNDARGISAYDASLVLQHSGQVITLTGSSAVAADVDKSGTISSMDASYILQQDVGLMNLPFPAGSVWSFNPDKLAYTGLLSNQSEQNFTAILLGEVSGNWSMATNNQMAAGGRSITLTVQPGIPDAAGYVTATIWADISDANLYSLDLTLAYSPSVAILVEVTKGPLLDEFAFAANLAQAGHVHVAAAGAKALQGRGQLLTLKFRLASSNVHNTRLVLVSGELNEGAVSSTLVNDNIAQQRVYLPLVVKVR